MEGILKTLCIKIDFSDPNGAENLKGSLTLTVSSRVIPEDVILDSDWLAKFKSFSWLSLIGFIQHLLLGKSRVCSALNQDKDW